MVEKLHVVYNSKFGSVCYLTDTIKNETGLLCANIRDDVV